MNLTRLASVDWPDIMMYAASKNVIQSLAADILETKNNERKVDDIPDANWVRYSRLKKYEKKKIIYLLI